jgi:hypothetical protein
MSRGHSDNQFDQLEAASRSEQLHTFKGDLQEKAYLVELMRPRVKSEIASIIAETSEDRVKYSRPRVRTCYQLGMRFTEPVRQTPPTNHPLMWSQWSQWSIVGFRVRASRRFRR